MSVYKDGSKWRVIYRYTDSRGERKQTQKRGFSTKKEAQAWCDGLTSANADFTSLDLKAREYTNLTATRREAIGHICPQKKNFIEAYAKDASQDMIKQDTPSCSAGASSVTITGSVSITGANLAGLSAYDVGVEFYLVPSSTIKGYQPSDKQTVAVPAGGSASLTSTVPLPSFDSGSCIVRAVSIWPSGV